MQHLRSGRQTWNEKKMELQMFFYRKTYVPPQALSTSLYRLQILFFLLVYFLMQRTAIQRQLKIVTVNCQIIYSAKKLISFNSLIIILKRHGNQGILKIRDITTSLYLVNLTLTKTDHGSNIADRSC